MGRNISKRSIFLALGVIAFIIFVAFGGIRVYRQWSSVQYFGRIVEIKNGTFIIQGDEGAQKSIAIKPHTIIRRGRNPVMERLEIGDYVFVVGSPNPQGFIEARVIRILEAPLL